MFGFVPLLTARDKQAAVHLYCPKQSLGPNYPLRFVQWGGLGLAFQAEDVVTHSKAQTVL